LSVRTKTLDLVKPDGTEYSCHPLSGVSNFWNQITRPTPD
jgi:hypothetical protein